MKKYLTVMRKAPIFSGISESEIETILHCLAAKMEYFPKGSMILRAGDSVDAAGLLLEGNALIVQEDFWGNRNLMAHLAPGQLFAETFACSPGAVLSVSIVAETACTVTFLNIRGLLTTCSSSCSHHNRLIRNLLADMAGKNLRFNEKIIHMGQRTTRDKLLSYLSAEAQRHGSVEFEIPFSRQQLADYLSVDRSGLSAELGKMRDEGLLEFQKNCFVLKQ